MLCFRNCYGSIPAHVVLMVSLVSVVLSVLQGEGYAEDELARRLALWERNAQYCHSGDGTRAPSKEHCDDGDTTLFNGLLCAAGDVRGCAAVRNAQEESGRWYRSPRLRVNHHAAEGASLSPDMALGIQLYLATTNDTERGYKWLKFIDDTVPCKVEKPFSSDCLIRSLPQFCPDSDNCIIRPGDAEVLNSTVDYLHQKGMQALPNGSLRGYLGTFASTIFNDYNAHTNKLGYSLHLVAVESFLLKKLGQGTEHIEAAIKKINERDSGNPFFEYLRDGPTDNVREIVLRLCPKDQGSIPAKLFQWSWERQASEQAWKESMLWDCIFMAKLLGH